MKVSRRTLLAAPALLAMPRALRAAETGLSPLETFLRIRCSPPETRTFWWYSGQMLARLTGEPARTMVSVIGVSHSQITRRPDGRIGYKLLEAGYYGHPDQRGVEAIADGPIANVLTGAPMTPEHYLSPQAIIFTPELAVLPDLPTLPPGLDYTGRITPPDIKAGRVWMAEELFVKAPPARSAPENGPRIANSLANFEAALDDVTSAAEFVPATMQYTTLNSFRPWMNMGTASGAIMMRLNAVKLPSFDAVPEDLRARILRDHPDFLA
ncbi:MAG: DUF1838 family protein [Polymorphobacter sp.]|uniref:DUF1838 family protein n=1 Tax=Polymorphobacter sp. TaxID=1909290 RepID=UPI003A84D796